MVVSRRGDFKGEREIEIPLPFDGSLVTFCPYRKSLARRRNLFLYWNGHLTCIALHDIFVLRYKGGESVADKSRADYFRQRRETRKHFSVLIDRRKAEAIEQKLAEEGKTKTAWLEEKIDEELGEQK